MLDQAIAYDTETTALSRWKGSMFAYSTCSSQGVIGVRRLDGSALRINQSRRILEELWADQTTAKVMHNAKFDLGHTERYLGKRLRNNPIHDTMLMSHILQNHHHGHALKDLAWELAGVPKDDEAAIKVFTRGGGSYQAVPEHLMTEYQKRDAERCMLLFLFFWPQIKENKDYLDCYQNEVALLGTTLDMEDRGVMVAPDRCKKLIAKLERDLQGTLRRFNELTGDTFLPSQPEHLSRFLYQTLKLPILGETKTGRPSTSKETLAELRKQHPHEALDLIAQYRSWTRGISMLTSYLDMADEEFVIHPNIKTCQAITGRESCSEPNLQNVEKSEALLNPYPVPAREVFRPRPGYVNFHIDYSGIEMRLLIHYSGDQILVDIAKADGDVHLPAAKIFFGRRFEEADPAGKKVLRSASKNANFAIAYGAQPAKVATTLGLSPGEGVARFNEYRKTFPKLCSLMRTITRQVMDNGRVITAFGRSIHVPKEMAYIGTNYLIQSTAAEILKRGQVRVHEFLQKETGGDLKILLPIHDELIIECPRKRLKDAKEIITKVSELMVSFPGRFRVPLGVEVQVATVDWAHKSDWR